MTFLPSLSSPQTLPFISSHFLKNSWHHFIYYCLHICIDVYNSTHLLSITYTLYIYIHYIYIFLNISFSVYIMLLVCLFSELIIWFRIKLEVLFPGKGLLFYSQTVSANYNSFCKVKPARAFLHWLWHVHWHHLSLAHTWAVMFVRVYMCSFRHS